MIRFRLSGAAILGLLALFPIPFWTGVARAAELNIYAAASLTEALRAVTPAWEAATGHRAVFNFAGSNVLALQIREGAPADVFVSADEARMDQLAGRKLLAEDTRVDLLGNALVVIVPKGATLVPARAGDLLDPGYRRLALADPRGVPAGIYARTWLKGRGLWDDLVDRVVPLDNVRSALAAVETGVAEAGIVYRTDALSSPRVRVAFRVPDDESPRIVYPVAALAASPRLDAARGFIAHLRSAEARAHFTRLGFVVLAQEP